MATQKTQKCWYSSAKRLEKYAVLKTNSLRNISQLIKVNWQQVSYMIG